MPNSPVAAKKPPKPACPNCAAPSPGPPAWPAAFAWRWSLAINPRLAWAVLPYLAVFLGLTLLRSAWGALIGFHLALFPLLLPAPPRKTHPLLAPVSWRLLLPFALTGLSAGIGLWILWPWLGIAEDFPARITALGLVKTGWLPFVMYFSTVNPFLEEIYWRGRLGSDSIFPRPVDFLYAGYHLLIVSLFVRAPWVVFSFVLLVLVSWLWRQISHRTGSLLPAALFHLLADFSLLMVIFTKAVSL